MLHYLASHMRESRMRMRDEELQSPSSRRTSNSARRSSSSRSRSQSHSHSRSRGDRRSARSQPPRSPRRRDEFYQFAPPMRLPLNAGLPGEPFLLSVDPAASRLSRPGLPSCQDNDGVQRLLESRTRRAITLSPQGNSNSQRPNVPGRDGECAQTGDGETQSGTNADPQQSSAWVFMSRRNQRTFARPWRFQEIYSDWSLTCIHRIFWLSVACIHIGIFLLFIGGFFHKTPSRLASSLVSLGIFILSSGLAMYTLAKSIIRARARQCERVLQVVLDLVEPPNNISGNEPSPDPDNLVGVVDSPPPYEAPPPYPDPLGTSSSGCAAAEENQAVVDGATHAAGTAASEESTAEGQTSVEAPKTPEENYVVPPLSLLPPTYSSIDIPDDVINRPERGELPPAYTEFP